MSTSRLVHILVDYGEKFHFEDPNYTSGEDMDSKDAAQVRRLEKHGLPHKENKEQNIEDDGDLDVASDKEEWWSEPTLDDVVADGGESNPLSTRIRRRSDVSENIDQAARTRRQVATEQAVHNSEVYDLVHDDDDAAKQDDERSNTEEEEAKEQAAEGEGDEKSGNDSDEKSGNDDDVYTDEQHAEKKQKVDVVPRPKPKQSRKKRNNIPKKKRGEIPEYPDASKFLTAYIMFSKEQRPTLSNVRPNQILIELGKMWKKTTPNEKQEYEEASKKTKKERDAWMLHHGNTHTL
jgi:hypothetical protein